MSSVESEKEGEGDRMRNVEGSEEEDRKVETQRRGKK